MRFNDKLMPGAVEGRNERAIKLTRIVMATL